MNQIPINLLEIHYATLSGLTGGMVGDTIFAYNTYYHYHYPIGCLFINCIALSFTQHLN